MEHDFKSDQARFTHLPRDKRTEISKQFQTAHERVRDKKRPGMAVRQLTDSLDAAFGVDEKNPESAKSSLSNTIWTEALKTSRKSGLASLENLLERLDGEYNQLNRQRRYQEQDQESAWMSVHKDIIENSWLKYRSTHTHLDDLVRIVDHTATWLRSLSQEERYGVLRFLQTHQAKYLPDTAVKAYDSTIENALIQEIWKGLLIETASGVDVSKNTRQVVRDTMHMVSPHEKHGL